VTAENAWQAVTQRPLSFLRSSWPWRSAFYLMTGVILGAVTTLLTITVGLLVLPLTLIVGGIIVARIERWRLRLVDFDPLPDPHAKVLSSGRFARLRSWFGEAATWRELGYMVITMLALWWIDLLVLSFSIGVPIVCLYEAVISPNADRWVALTFGVILPPIFAYPLTAWTGARAALSRAVLAPRDTELGRQVVELTRSRKRLVDAFEVERRRIERDLHDGAQQRLVALNMTLGLARLDAQPGSPVAQRLEEAHGQAKQVLEELRELIRGVHPQILTDRGLAAAIDEIASRSPVPVDVDIVLPGRLAPAAEATAYFFVSEALTNVAKHSGAARARVHGRTGARQLIVEVRDDGRGGAHPADGSGLSGLTDRVAAVGGKLILSSPPGGPTLIRVELPC
jgi:signal transduction histidine kinase